MAAGTCLLIACNQTKDSITVGIENDHAAMAKRNDEKIREVYRAIETGDVSKLDTFIADNVMDHERTPDGREINNLDNLKKFLVDMHNHFKDLKFDFIAHATGGDYHFTMVNMYGISTDDQFGMPANTTMNAPFVDVVRLRDGKIVEHWGFQ